MTLFGNIFNNKSGPTLTIFDIIISIIIVLSYLDLSLFIQYITYIFPLSLITSLFLPLIYMFKIIINFLPNQTDILLILINITTFIFVQRIFFTKLASKSTLVTGNDFIKTIREMVLTATYNKIDINNDITMSETQLIKLDKLIIDKNNINEPIIQDIDNKIKYLSLGSILLYCYGYNKYGKSLYKTFMSTPNLLLISITICFYITELYLYNRYINRLQLVTIYDLIEDPELYDANLSKYKNDELNSIYNDYEIQIINDINLFINNIKTSVSYLKNDIIDDFKHKALLKIQKLIIADENILKSINTKAIIDTKIEIIKKNVKLYNNLKKSNDFLTKLNNYENKEKFITNKISKKIKTITNKALSFVFNDLDNIK